MLVTPEHTIADLKALPRHFLDTFQTLPRHGISAWKKVCRSAIEAESVSASVAAIRERAPPSLRCEYADMRA